MKGVQGGDSECSSDESEPEQLSAAEEDMEPVPQPEGIDEPVVPNPAPVERRYPTRERQQREIPGTVSWDSVNLDDL